MTSYLCRDLVGGSLSEPHVLSMNKIHQLIYFYSTICSLTLFPAFRSCKNDYEHEQFEDILVVGYPQHYD